MNNTTTKVYALDEDGNEGGFAVSAERQTIVNPRIVCIDARELETLIKSYHSALGCLPLTVREWKGPSSGKKIAERILTNLDNPGKIHV